MDARITPSSLHGSIPAIPSKSMAHRLLILSALSDEPCEVTLGTTSHDIEATSRCLAALAHGRTASHHNATSAVVLDCGESGSTLRFLLPVVCALGVDAQFVCHGRLGERPLSPLDAQLREHGIHLEKRGATWEVSGTLAGGRFTLPGDVSSQFASGLLMAATLLSVPTEVLVSRPVQSRPYIDLTIRALELFGIQVARSRVEVEGAPFERHAVCPSTPHASGSLSVEGDWSNAAFWLAAGSLEPEGLTVSGLDLLSAQGDRAIMAALAAMGIRIARRGAAVRATADTPRAACMDVQNIPDLVPPLAAVAAVAPGTSRFCNAGRLRLKESDRLATVCAAITALGGSSHVEKDDLVIEGVDTLAGGMVDAANDHRIAMMAAVMATHASGPVTIRGAECVAKSYPAFWDDYRSLGGAVEYADEEA